jgi:hypothetical protein
MKGTYKSLERLLISFYLWILLEGAVRKWLLPSYTDIIYFVKYLLALAILIRIVDLKISLAPFYKLLPAFNAFFFFCFLSLLYVSVLNNTRVGVLGMLSYFAFIPLLIAIPSVLNSVQKVERLFIMAALISILISILGIIQFYSAPDSFINRYATNELASIDTAGLLDDQVVRVSTLFSYHSGNATCVLTSFVFMIPLLFTQYKNVLLKWSIYLAFSLNVVSLFMTGSRAAVFLACIVFILYLIFNLPVFINNLLALRGLLLLSILLIAIFLFTDTGSRSYQSWNTRFVEGSKNNEYQSRTNDLFSEIQEVLFQNPGGILGYGIGVYQNGASRFNTLSELPGAEDQAHRIGLELGPFGLLLWYMFIVSVCYYMYAVYKTVNHPFLKSVALVLFIYSLWGPALLRQIQINWVDNLVWWSCLGITAAIYQISKNLSNHENLAISEII